MKASSTWSGQFSKVIRGTRWIAVCAAVLTMAASLASQTAARANRITQDVNSGPITTVAGTVHPLTQRATDLGAINSEMQLGWLTLNISLSPVQQSELESLMAAQQNPASPLYHQWLTQEEYGARFGLTDTDLNTVTSWLKSQGFTVTGVSKSRNAIHFSGKVWQVEAAFHTQMHSFELKGETHVANATNLRVPAGIASVMLNVRGLDNFRPKPHAVKQITPGYTVNTSQGITHFLTPADWATIYGVNAIYSAGFTGAGAHVGVVGQTYAPLSDITNFRNNISMGAPNINYECIDPTTSNCTGSSAISTTGDLGEADLDIEWAGGIAMNATVDFVYAPAFDVEKVVDSGTGNYYDVFDALQHAVQDYKVASTGSVLPVISMSYTDCEQDFYNSNGSVDSTYVALITTIGSQAQAQGQTIVVASGDTGPAGCDFDNYPAKDGVSAAIPVDSPYYTGVGGTTLSGDEASPDTYWIETLNTISTAKSYIGESVWNDTSASNGLSASGGGVSLFYSQPSWQTGLVSGVTSGRMIPDVSFAASPNHDGYMVCSQEDNSNTYGTVCASGFMSSKGYFDVYGGTSASTPSFAGMLTLLAQAQGKGLGNINPTLYALAKSNAAVFNDVTSGNNDVPCRSGTTGCVSGTMGWPATTGYDLATGLGSVNGGALYLALQGKSATTSTTVSASSPVTIGGTTTLTASVTPSAATGSVVFMVGTTAQPATSLTSGTATLSNLAVSTANGFSGGSDTITATYSGDATYASSVSTTLVTVINPTYTLSAASSTASISAGSSTQVTLNLVSTSGYAGTVSFTATVTSSGGTPADVNASAPSVVLTANGSGSTVLTIATTASAANHAPGHPWKSGGAVVFCAVLLGGPFTLRRKRVVAVLLVSATILLAGVMLACGGGGSNAAAKTTTVAAARTYTVTVTPTSSPAVSNPAAVSVIVTVQ